MLARWSQYAALPLRLVLGAVIFVRGSQKLFGYFGGSGLADTAQFMESVGLMPGGAWAWTAGLVEIIGGSALILGVLTRWTALVLSLESLAAIAVLATGASVDVSFRLAMLAGLVALGMTGPQGYALDTTVPTLASWSGAEPAEQPRKAA